MTIKVGDKIPEATLVRATEAGPSPISTAELFGGRLELKSAPGEGTRVTLVVPVEAGDDISAAPGAATKPGGL